MFFFQRQTLRTGDQVLWRCVCGLLRVVCRRGEAESLCTFLTLMQCLRCASGGERRGKTSSQTVIAPSRPVTVAAPHYCCHTWTPPPTTTDAAAPPPPTNPPAQPLCPLRLCIKAASVHLVATRPRSSSANIPSSALPLCVIICMRHFVFVLFY